MNTITLHPGTPIKIAIMAMGGQGGGVLADWIVDLGEHCGWWAQTTSVPGVAQRTGATINYLELLPESASEASGSPPILALIPTPGDVDIVIASELMEAGRAMQRGLVTPDRTTLITSTHRSLAISEKAAPGNGIADPNKVLEAGQIAARKFIGLDFQALAEQQGSVISASLFGGLAGTGVLPFKREDFEATIRRGGLGVEASLKAFAIAYEAASRAPATPPPVDRSRPLPPMPETGRDNALLRRLREHFPAGAQPMILAGLRRLIDYQDVDYAAEYLQRLAELHAADARHGGATRDWAFTQAAARHLATAMSYDDVIRVADLKTRAERFRRIAGEVGVKPGQLLYTTEFTHPRLEEICGTLPVLLGRYLERSGWFAALVKRHFAHGKRIESARLGGFLMLYLAAGMRRFRRSTLRYQVETEVTRNWIEQASRTVEQDYALAVEILNCRRLVKGYGDTHARGNGKFRRVLEAARQLAGQTNAAERVRQLREAALADETCASLELELERCFNPA
ncbi:MAG: indolepyruvate oxidoreductase subunit beta family protein [Sterolibacterium sp.]